MAITSVSPTPKLQFFDLNGAPLSGGKLYTYAAGTTTPLASYTDSTGNIANTNPIILDIRGEANGPVTNLTGDGTTLVFTIAAAARSVYINGVYQNINTYTTTSASITFSQAPPYTSLIEVVCN